MSSLRPKNKIFKTAKNTPDIFPYIQGVIDPYGREPSRPPVGVRRARFGMSRVQRDFTIVRV